MATVPDTTTLSIVVAILTYRRPAQLEQTLRAVNEQIAEPAPATHRGSTHVLVVDNDPSQSARPVVERTSPHALYCCEPVPGIAAARNRAVRESTGTDLLVFIDDDELPRPGWLTNLVETWHRYGALAVAGRVVPKYQTPPDAWILAGRFFDRPERTTGTRMASIAAGNLLLDLRQLRQSGLVFEEPFGATGGEDSLLGQRAVKAGYDLVWCAESVVEDLVPVERLTRTWVLRRAYSLGNLQTLIDCHLAESRPRTLAAQTRRAAAGCLYLVKGSGRAATGYVRRSHALQADGLRNLCRGLGMLAGIMGRVYEPYARHEDVEPGLSN